MIALALLAAIVPAGAAFACTPVSVWDGDGPIRCAEGPKVRLRGVAARELDGSCRRLQPCPDASGVAARDFVVRLLGGPRGRLRTGHVRVAGPTLACRSLGGDAYGRTVATCRGSGFGDLSCALVTAGLALRWRRFGGAEVCGARR